MVLSNQQRLLIPLDQADSIVAAIDHIVSGTSPELEDRVSIRQRSSIMLVAVKLEDGGLYPCVCQTDAEEGTFELRQGWEAVLKARKLKAGDIVGVKVDPFSSSTCIILHLHVWGNARAEAS